MIPGLTYTQEEADSTCDALLALSFSSLHIGVCGAFLHKFCVYIDRNSFVEMSSHTKDCLHNRSSKKFAFTFCLIFCIFILSLTQVQNGTAISPAKFANPACFVLNASIETLEVSSTFDSDGGRLAFIERNQFAVIHDKWLEALFVSLKSNTTLKRLSLKVRLGVSQCLKQLLNDQGNRDPGMLRMK